MTGRTPHVAPPCANPSAARRPLGWQARWRRHSFVDLVEAFVGATAGDECDCESCRRPDLEESEA